MKLSINNLKKVNRYKFIVLCVIILSLFNLRNINVLTMPSILLDEFGYWAPAALGQGHDWSGVVSKYSPYYSYGYSAILFLAMELAQNPQIQHMIAIIFNTIFIIGIFIISNYFINKIFSAISPNIRVLSCFIICFSPNVLYHSQVAWSEIFLTFLFWLSVFIIIKICNKRNSVYCIIFACNLMMMYVTHQRSIGVIISGCIVTIILYFYKIIKTKHIIAFFLTIIFGVFLQGILKESILLNLYHNNSLNIYSDIATQIDSTLVNINDYAGQVGKIKYLFTLEGGKNFLISFLGKIYYFGLASFMIGFEGIKVLFFNSKKTKDWKQLFSIYLLLSFFSTVCVSAIFMIYPARIDTVAYGRYTDWMALPIILIGVIEVLNHPYKKMIKRFLYYGATILIFTLIFQKYINQNNVAGFFSSCSPIMTSFKKMGTNGLIITMTVVIIGCSFFILSGTILKNIVFRSIFIATFMIFSWLIITKPAIDELIYIRYEDGVLPVAEYMINTGQDYVYYIFDEDKKTFQEDAYMGSVQFLLNDKSVRCISADRITEISGQYAIIGKSYELPGKILKDYNIVYENWLYRILKIY